MLVAGVTLTARMLWGRSFSDIPVFLTLYEGGVPVAAIVGQNTVAPSMCGVDDLRKRFVDWKVSLQSSHKRTGWVFFAVVYLPDVDPSEFARIVIDDEKRAKRSPRTNEYWTDELAAEFKRTSNEINDLKIEMHNTPKESSGWQDLYEQVGVLMSRCSDLNRIKFSDSHQGGREICK
jgi:hypothetical protein